MDKFRLITLSTTCFISFLVFWITFVVTVVWDHCWSFEQFWFETQLPATPFDWFLFLFIIIAIWWLAETILIIINKTFDLFRISITSIVMVFLLIMAVVFYNFNIYYGLTKGTASKESFILLHYEEYVDWEEYTVGLLNKDGELVEKPSFDYEHWLTFRDSMTCDKGIDFNLLNKDEWSELNTQYQLLIRQEYEKIGLDYDDPTKYNREQK